MSRTACSLTERPRLDVSDSVISMSLHWARDEDPVPILVTGQCTRLLIAAQATPEIDIFSKRSFTEDVPGKGRESWKAFKNSFRNPVSSTTPEHRFLRHCRS
jgi:hypothetical protein